MNFFYLKYNKVLSLIILLLGCWNTSLYALKIHLPEIDTIGFTDYTQFSNDGTYERYSKEDTVRFILEIPNLNNKVALYVGTAEYILVESGDTSLYIGKYAPKKPSNLKLYNFVWIPEQFKGKVVNITCYNMVSQEYFIAPHVITQKLVLLNQEYTYKAGRRGIIILILFIGSVFFFALYCYLTYWQFRTYTEYLYLGIHMTGMLIFTLIQADSIFHTYVLFPRNPIIYHQLNDSTLFLSYIGLMLLMQDFLDLKILSPKINKITNQIILYNIICSILLFIFAANHILPNYNKALTLTYIGAFVLCFIQNKLILQSNKLPYKSLSIAGNIILLLFLFSEFCLVRFGNEDNYYWALESPIFCQFYSFNIAQVGNLIFLIFYAMAIGYKRKKMEQELLNFQTEELQKLENIGEQGDHVLRMMKKKEADQQNQLERFEYLFNQRKTAIGLLKSNINPQFVQNNVDVIQQNIQTGFLKNHRWHITKFSKLFQNSIEVSNQKLISLSKEIENIKLYLELEELRLNKELNHKLIMNYDLIKSKNVLPPFLVQEYIEFCLWNILYSKNSQSKLLIKFTKKEDQLWCIIRITGKLDNIYVNKFDLDKILERINEKIIYSLETDREVNHVTYYREKELIQLTLHIPQPL